MVVYFYWNLFDQIPLYVFGFLSIRYHHFWYDIHYKMVDKIYWGKGLVFFYISFLYPGFLFDLRNIVCNFSFSLHLKLSTYTCTYKQKSFYIFFLITGCIQMFNVKTNVITLITLVCHGREWLLVDIYLQRPSVLYHTFLCTWFLCQSLLFEYSRSSSLVNLSHGI